MKRLVLTCIVALFAVCSYAQDKVIAQFLSGAIDKEAFVDGFVGEFSGRYTLDADQVEKLTLLAERKAKNYGEIKTLASQPDTYVKKLESQKIHTMQSMRNVLNKEQYNAYMKGYRVAEKRRRAGK